MGFPIGNDDHETLEAFYNWPGQVNAKDFAGLMSAGMHNMLMVDLWGFFRGRERKNVDMEKELLEVREKAARALLRQMNGWKMGELYIVAVDIAGQEMVTRLMLEMDIPLMTPDVDFIRKQMGIVKVSGGSDPSERFTVPPPFPPCGDDYLR